MKRIKKIAASLLACVMLATMSVSASAEVSLAFYKNIQGGPSHFSEDFWIYKNTGNSYYAECTYITSGTLTITGTNNTPNKYLEFSSCFCQEKTDPLAKKFLSHQTPEKN